MFNQGSDLPIKVPTNRSLSSARTFSHRDRAVLAPAPKNLNNTMTNPLNNSNCYGPEKREPVYRPDL